jgi:dTMP kinase
LYPTLTILIDVPAEIGLSRLQSRDRLESEPTDFHERVRQEFLQIAMMDPERYFVVDGTQSVEEIHEQIITRVAELPALKRNAQGPQQNKFLKPIRIATSAVTKRIKK